MLDRTWILDRVFTHNLQALALDALSITHVHIRNDTEIGPQDQTRRTELAVLEERISATVAAKQISSAVVDDALEAARLVRALEQPSMQVEASYLRAERIAGQYGSRRQKAEVAYQWASTRYYWLEDFVGFSELYAVAEKRVRGSRNIFDLERLYTLWVCLWMAVRHSALDASAALLQQRSRVLCDELKRLKGEHERPSTALQAEMLLLEIELFRHLGGGEQVGYLLQALSDVIERSHGLVGFPLRALFRTLSEVGNAFEGIEEYDELFEQIIEISAERDGELAAARLLLKRGLGQWEGGRPVEAIATLGRALLRLYKEESSHELAEALYACGCACAEVGLPWAARGMLLASASRSADVYWKYGKVTPGLHLAALRLKWIELSLGRLPQLLTWHENTVYLGQTLIDRGEDPDTVRAEDIHFEHLLSGLLLRTPAHDLPHLESLPGVLDDLGLDLAGDGLLFALGHEQRLDELAASLGQTAQTMASTWAHGRGAGSAAERPNDITPSERVYQSNVMGCALTLACDTSPQCVALAEGLLATVEATLATAGLHHVLVHEPRFTIRVCTDAAVPFPFEAVKLDSLGGPVLEIRCSNFDPHRLSPEQHEQIHDKLGAACIEVVASVVIADEPQLKELFHGERALERAFNFAGSLVSQPNVLGFEPKMQLSAWLSPELPRFNYRRKSPWRPDPAPETRHERPEASDPVEEEVRNHFNPVHMSHSQMRVNSLIRMSLWDRAGWTGMGFEFGTGVRKWFRLGLLFNDREAGRLIFQGWKERLGQVDEEEHLRIAIVRGVDRHSPLIYRVVIGANVAPGDDVKLLFMTSRIHDMNPQSSYNIDMLLEFQAHNEGIFLMPGVMTTQADGVVVPDFDESHCLLIRQVVVRDAWEIGMHDPEVVAIKAGDEPIIPEHVSEPPVLEVLAKWHGQTAVPAKGRNRR